MDPDAALQQIRDEIAKCKELEKDDQYMGAFPLVDLVEALDGWLSKGGFLPKAWDLGDD